MDKPGPRQSRTKGRGNKPSRAKNRPGGHLHDEKCALRRKSRYNVGVHREGGVGHRHRNEPVTTNNSSIRTEVVPGGLAAAAQDRLDLQTVGIWVGWCPLPSGKME